MTLFLQHYNVQHVGFRQELLERLDKYIKWKEPEMVFRDLDSQKTKKSSEKKEKEYKK